MAKKKNPKNKYGAVTVEKYGYKFNSLMELEFYEKELMNKPLIHSVEFEPKFTLLEGFEYQGKKVKPITYKADFLVTYIDGSKEVIEIKGFVARDFPLRKKLFQYNNPNLTLSIYTSCPIKFGGGFILLDELTKLRAKEKRAKRGQKTEAKEVKQTGEGS